MGASPQRSNKDYRQRDARALIDFGENQTEHERRAIINEMTPYFVGAISALGGCIVVLWRITRKQDKDVQHRLKDCEDDREDLRSVLLHTLDCLTHGDTKGLDKAFKHMERWADKKRHKPPSDKPCEEESVRT